MKRKLISSALALLFTITIGTVAMAADQTTDQGRTTDHGQMTNDQMRSGEGAATGDMRTREMEGQDMMEARQDAQESVISASTVITEMTAADAEKRIPDNVLQQAQGIVIIPGVIKAGLIAGGRYGRGVLMTKNQDQWSLPAFVTIGGASIGAQLGVEESDLVMVFNNRDAIQNLLDDGEFKIGVDASVAAGTAGAKAKAETGAADVVMYQRTEGLFAGVSLTGGVLSVDEDAMMAYYHEPSARAYYGEDEAQVAQQILKADEKEQPQLFENVPQSAKDLQQAISKVTSAGK